MLPDRQPFAGFPETEVLRLAVPVTGLGPGPVDCAEDDASPVQFGMWVLRQLGAPRASRVVQLRLGVAGHLRRDTLAAAFRHLISGHAFLRKRFHLTGDRLRAVPAPPDSFSLEYDDLSGLEASFRETEAIRRFDDAAQSDSGLPVRAVVLRLHQRYSRLLLQFDRMVADRFSAGAFCSELFRLYAALSAVPALAPDAFDAAEQDPYPGSIEFTLSKTESERLHAAAAVLDETPAAVLLASFYLLLSRLLPASEVTAGVEARIGGAVCRLPLTVSLADDPEFARLVHRLSGAHAAISAWTPDVLDLVFSDMAQQCASGQPLFPAAFGFATGVPDTLWCPGLRFGRLPQQAVPEADLQLNVTNRAGSFHGVLVCDGVFRSMAPSISQVFGTIVNGVCGNPHRRISDYELTLEGGGTDAKSGACVPFVAVTEVIDRHAAARPDAIAAVCGSHHLTYQCLRTASDAVATALRARGIGRESTVAMVAPRDITTLVGILGILKANAIYLPLEPSSSPARMESILNDSRAALLLRRKHHDVRLDGWAGPVLDPHEVAVAGIAEASAWNDQLAGQLAYIMYTSGSTGKPKGVLVTHRGMSGHVFAKVSDLALGVADRVAETAPCTFDISVWQFLSPLAAGGTVVIFPEDSATDPMLLLETLRRMDVTVWETVPVLLGLAVDELKRRETSYGSLPALRCLISNAEALPTDLAAAWRGLCPEVRLVNTYGATEASDDVTHHTVAGQYTRSVAVVPLGKTIGDATVHVLDPSMRPMPAALPGEIFIGGPWVARGYINQPGITAERFVPDPFADEPGQRLYRTGDLARRTPDGDLDFLGRVDDETKIRGHRVEPEQVAALARTHPAVLHCAVVPFQTESGEKRLAGFVGLRQTGTSLEDISTFLASSLPSYMVPSALFECSELPVNQNGKLDRKALLALARRSSPVAPGTATEAILTTIFAETLEIPHPGIRDDFFELGGNARSAVSLTTRIQTVTGIALPLATVYAARTVEAIGRFVDAATTPLTLPELDHVTQSELYALLSDCIAPGA